MRTAKSACTILISLAILVMPMLGQVDRGVIVSCAGNEISVSIARTTPLATVLDEVCRAASALCSGTTQAMATMVPAQEVRGDWRHVISTLLEGAGFNYIASAPSESSPGMLQITGAASQGRPEPATENSADAASADAASLSASASTPQSSGAEEAGQSQSSDGAEQASMGGQPDRLFSASDGSSNSAPGQSPVSMLFPDSNGNLIPIASQGSASYSLFPDSKGNPIPASNQALPYQLFPDGNGRLIPVQRGGR